MKEEKEEYLTLCLAALEALLTVLAGRQEQYVY